MPLIGYLRPIASSTKLDRLSLGLLGASPVGAGAEHVDA